MKELIQFELRKIFSKHLTQAALIALLLLSFLLGFSSYQNMYAAYFYQNALQSAVFRYFSDLNGNWNGLSVSDVFGNEEIKIGYTYGWLTTSQNLIKILIVLSLAAVIMTAPVFSGEYGGVDDIIFTSKYGKTKCWAAKIIGSILAMLFVTTAILILNLIYALVLYGNDGLDCSILFAPIDFADGYIPFHITCGTLLKYQILLAFTGTISITGITLVLSAVCKNQMAALAASAAIYLFPFMLPVTETSPLFKIVTLFPLYHAQFASLMSVAQISGNVLYALMAVPAALIFLGIGVFTSHSFFTKHQVS